MSQYFFLTDLKLYLWSIHMANNLILAISFGLKLNSNLNATNVFWLAVFGLLYLLGLRTWTNGK